MEKVLIAGANGTTGREIVKNLQDHASYEPIAMIRKEEQQATFDNMNVKSIIADLEGGVEPAVQGIDRVIFAAGSGGKKVKEVDRDGAINLIDRSKAAGVRKFVMLSSMGTDDPSQNEELQEYLEAKKEADEHLKSSFLEYSIVRPGALTNNEKTNKIKAAEKLGEYGEIPRKDVAQVLVDCLQPNMLKNKTFEILSGERATELALQEINQVS
ncbi:SDR family oxidoreductase [Mesonia ostreae]|uniref:SDR family oxidoreductase n=1 Tax=Mesonia ostreae TaxID=861110 RepID=A0ABU2KJB7_9FLAO|nr:SDR family oxidoreductase [Mesonia ostreae]MDT0294816.1 SDR family oxidoreductase [Mesonia ostreae]